MDFTPGEQYQPIGPGTQIGSRSPTVPGGGPGSDPDADNDGAGSGVPCQRCEQGPARVQTYMWVMSFLVITRHREYQANLCRACSAHTALKEQIKSAVLGWWGIPWGVMTFKALWVNARALARWSTLPALFGMLTVVAGVAVPVAVGYSVWAPYAEERQARAIGDWVTSDVVALLEEGNDAYDAGELEKALASYREAYERAPKSTSVNVFMAQTLDTLGRLDEALPFAERATKLDPTNPARAAMYGDLLAAVKGPEAAQKQAAALRGIEPPDVEAAFCIARLFDTLGEYDQVLHAARAGLADEPAAAGLVAEELTALVELDRLDEAGAIVHSLDKKQLAYPYMVYAADLYRMRTEPLAEAERLCANMAKGAYKEKQMSGLVRAADRAGKLEQARAAVRRCLFDPATRSTAWGWAEPWFGDSFTAELDAYLAERPEPLPALLRLRRYDPISDAVAIRRLGSRVDDPDARFAQLVDAYTYGIPVPGESLATMSEALLKHLETAPDHTGCRLLLAELLARTAPEQAAAQLEILDRAAEDDPALAVGVARGRAEVDLALGELADAVAAVADLEPAGGKPYVGPGLIDLTAAEAAFHAGKAEMLRERLETLLHGNDDADHAAALLIRWSDELATGAPITYRQDVDRLLETAGDSLLFETSPSVQGILIAEGRVDARQREELVPEETRGTLVLARLFHDAAERGHPDLEAFARLAGSPHASELAPLLARTALARRGRQRDAV